jgi:predicted SnoaL-like aldol condensation-catalyzing enzyme
MKEKSSSYNKQIATKWFDAFNEHDVEKILLLYDENAEHYSPKLKLRMPETKGLINGKDALRNWWKDSFDRLPSLQYEVINLTADEDQVFMEYIRHVSGEDDLSVGEVLQIENGLIKFSRVYHG